MGIIEGGMPPPPGVVPNFANPDKYLFNWDIATQVLCISFMTIFYLLRMYTKLYIHGSLNREDWTCSVAYVLGLGYSVTTIIMGHYGGGLHQWEVPKENIVPFNKTVYGTMVLYGPTAFVTKASILLILTRVFTPYRKMIKFIYVFFGFMLAYYIPAIIIKIRICLPISRFWLGEGYGKCLDERAIILADAIISVISDLIILVLPLILTHSLQMSFKKRVRIISILGAGGLACASSIVRLVFIVDSGDSVDQTWTFMRVNLWGNAEVSIGIICACLPALAALVTKISRSAPGQKGSGRSPDYEMGGVNSMQPAVSTSQTTEVDSDRDILLTYPPGFQKIETAIRGGRQGEKQDQRRDRLSFTGRGIMKTVDMSHSVSKY